MALNRPPRFSPVSLSPSSLCLSLSLLLVLETWHVFSLGRQMSLDG